MPCSAASSVSAARTVGVRRTGQRCSPIRATAAASAADGVVVVDLGAVSGLAVGGQLEPGGAALAGRRPGRAAGRGPAWKVKAPDSLMPSVQPSNSSACSVHEEAGAVGGAVLLVRGEGEHDVAARAGGPGAPRPGRWPGSSRPCSSCRSRRVPTRRRPRTSPENGWTRPVGGLRGDHVQVAVDQQGVGCRGRCPRSGPRRWCGRGRTPGRSARSRRRQQVLGDVFGGGSLDAVAAAPVGGVDPDQVRGEAHHLVERELVERCRHRRGSSPLSHTVPPPLKRRVWSRP